MTRSKLSLRSLTRAGLKFLILATLLVAGCSSSTSPTFPRENITRAMQDICKKEYKLDIKATLSGRTLWIYLPLENMLSKNETPEKFTEKFLLEENNSVFNDNILRVDYLIKPVKEEKESRQEMGIDRKVSEKIFAILQVTRRVLFSADHSKKDTPLFFCIVIADTKHGFEIKEIFYYPDLQKLSYGFISQTEYQHRIVQDTDISAQIIGDEEGKHLNYEDIRLADFIAGQIRHRIQLKFQKPEVQKNVDIDKEVLKVVSYTIKTYAFKDFSIVELANLYSNSKTLLNQAAIFAKPSE